MNTVLTACFMPKALWLHFRTNNSPHCPSFLAIKIVVGYFIVRHPAKGCGDCGNKTTNDGKLSQKELNEIYKDAVEMVSPESYFEWVQLKMFIDITRPTNRRRN